MLTDIALWILRSWGLRGGLVFLATALMLTGAKYYEHSAYISTAATVTGTKIKCEAGYPSGRRRIFETVLDCADVPRLKARHPDADWQVTSVTFVDLRYTIESGDPIRTTVRLGKLERPGVTVGETITVLRSPSDPAYVTGPFSPTFLKLLLIAYAIGIGLLLASFGARWMSRERSGTSGLQVATEDSDTPIAASPTIAPRQATVGSGFGRRISGNQGLRSR